MPIEILMPALSPTMTEGNLVNWVKKEGDEVKPGDVIAEIETDKATMEVEAVDGGTLGKIVIPAGTENVKVNDVIALILEEGEDKKSLTSYKPKAGNTPQAKPEPTEKEAPGQKSKEIKTEELPKPKVEIKQSQGRGSDANRLKASPLAKRLAREKGIDLQTISGSGPAGRVVKADLANAAPAGGVARDMGEYEEIPNNNIRKVIARRLLEAKTTIPHFYLTIDVEIDALIAMRATLNEMGKDKYKISLNDLVIKAAALSLRDVRAANASWTESAIRRYKNIDISVAVAIKDGLITPIIKNADQKSIVEISSEMKELAAKARDHKLKPEEFQGGSFSITNLGMYGIKNFQAIINPPQSCILAIGAGEERAIIKNGEITKATVMSCSLSSDHRVVDGVIGAEFLSVFKSYIEEPMLMFIYK